MRHIAFLHSKVRGLAIWAIGMLAIGAVAAFPANKDLSLTIAFKDAKACRGIPQLALTAETVNSGRETVAIRFDSVAQIIELYPAPKIKPGDSRVDVGSYRVIPLKQPEFVLLEPGKSFTYDIAVKVPADIPAGTKQLRITVVFFAQPEEKRHQNVKTFRGDIRSGQLKLDLVDCAGSRP